MIDCKPPTSTPGNSTCRARVVVSGIVQGVCYRDFTRRRAFDLGLTGWVRNLPDGRVEAIAKGGRTQLLQLIDEMRAGPPGSRVESIEVSWSVPGAEFRGFEIRY